MDENLVAFSLAIDVEEVAFSPLSALIACLLLTPIPSTYGSHLFLRHLPPSHSIAQLKIYRLLQLPALQMAKGKAWVRIDVAETSLE